MKERVIANGDKFADLKKAMRKLSMACDICNNNYVINEATEAMDLISKYISITSRETVSNGFKAEMIPLPEITLRDYFAGIVMGACLKPSIWTDGAIIGMSRLITAEAYQIADEIIKERNEMQEDNHAQGTKATK